MESIRSAPPVSAIDSVISKESIASESSSICGQGIIHRSQWMESLDGNE